MRTLIAAAFACASAVLAVPAQAQTDDSAMSPWFIRLGAVELQNLHGLDATLAGQPLPGAELNYHHVYTAMVEVGYNFMPDVSVVLGAKVDQIDPTAAYNTVGPDLAVEVLSLEQDAEYVESELFITASPTL